MEMCGLVLSVPATFVLTVGYCALLEMFMPDHGGVRRLALHASATVLGLFATELVFLGLLGPVKSRALIGPLFYPAHLVSFFLSIPALANALILTGSGRRPLRGRPFLVATICALFALPLVLVQYGVSEALYGMPGMSTGPYSDPQGTTIIFSPNRHPKFKKPDAGPRGSKQGSAGQS